MDALLLAALSLTPVPDGAEFTDRGRAMLVVGRVAAPPNDLAPARAHGVAVWREEFEHYGVPVLNVCRERDGAYWVYPPRAIWPTLKR